MDQPTQFPLDMNAEVAARQQQPARPQSAESAMELEAQIAQKQREAAVSEAEMNPLAYEKKQRDLNYQRQIEQLEQPETAPILAPETTPELDRLESLQKELDDAKAEASKWKKQWSFRTGEIGVMKRELSDLKAQVGQITPAINVQQITGREPGDPITAQDAVNLLMSQSQAFGNVINQIREEVRNAQTNPQDGGLPLDMEAELVESHPWLNELSRPQKLRAMHDILASVGVSVAPPSANTPAAVPPTQTLPAAARTPLRQVTYTEPSNRGSAAERTSITPERQALNDKLAKIRELQGKPGGSDEMARILASLGAGPVDETQQGVFVGRR